ncbi:MAG: molybdenum cofactor guanylyltransferase [Planctomycetota bacterium]|nr:MAG: molybdenum cofactor guanylyltransferase [Planctomycetota bacterium]
MLKIPGMLMVGSTGRGSGKTRFVCSLINKFGLKHNIIGLKVTPVQKANGTCPRGGLGCGVCSSLKGHFYITEETDSRANKDTSRMLAAGAAKVFWLRVLRKYLEDGANELLKVIGNDAVSVCESNSLRRVVEPGVFVVVKSCSEQSPKPSAKNVIRYADRIVAFDGDKFDVGVGEFELVNGRWACKMQATAIIMAGGESARMGRNKSLLPINGQPMIKYIYDQLRPHFNQILISSNDVFKYSFLGAEVIPDEILGHGPLGGIASAIKASANDLNFVIACDIPQLDIDLMKALLRQGRSFDAVVPRIDETRYEPLFALYKKSALKTIQQALLSGNNRIIDALGSCKVKYINLDDAHQIENLNTMKDYCQFTGR